MATKIGVSVILHAWRQLRGLPGVYRMKSAQGKVLYVGKAKNLKNRVATYTRPDRLPIRLQRMVASTAEVEVTITHTESEALLLESYLIKQFSPPYNVLLRDDKSFPYLKITQHPYPQMSKHRGAIDKQNFYFGPFASIPAVNKTLDILHRTFQLRSCTDTTFQQRKRPCLEYHIKRCTAPCVGYVSQEDYAGQVDGVKEFLTHKSYALTHTLSRKMEEAAAAYRYEEAARYRDQIQHLSQIQQHQGMHVQELADVDFVVCVEGEAYTCFQVVFFRNGYHLGDCNYFLKPYLGESLEKVFTAFLMQFYDQRPAPSQIMTSLSLKEREVTSAALSHRHGKSVALRMPVRGVRKKIMDQAILNASDALRRKASENASHQAILKTFQEALRLPSLPKRIEVYDNSHLFGQDAYGAMIVVGEAGFEKKAYRKFKILPSNPSGGDDYTMMREMMQRRFRNRGDVHEHLPDVLVIDGGRGQVTAVVDVLRDCGLASIPCLGIAKGPNRNAGQERFFLSAGLSLDLEPSNPLRFFLQRIRDEAHRFAIGSHKAARSKNMTKSILLDIPGVGAKRKKALLHHFGSAYNVSRAGVEDLQAAEGVDRVLAEVIYKFFHP